MLLPNTAAPNNSIWSSIDRRIFENHVHELCAAGVVPKPHIYSESEWPKESEKSVIDFLEERQLADDFAFIAAYEYDVNCVTAAAIELRNVPWSFILRLAANEGINANVREAMEDILQQLKKCALRETHRSRCKEEMFDTIITLNSNRILGRLGSRFFRQPEHMRGYDNSPLSLRLRSRIESPRSCPMMAPFKAELEEFHNCFLRLEASKGEELISMMKVLVKKAFEVTKDGTSLPQRLQEMGVSASAVDNKEIRQLGKLASYWRISSDLAERCRSSPYRHLFQHPKLEVLQHYQYSGNRKKKKHIHAEVQLVVHYEKSGSPEEWPRAIGSSKEACFLCDAFIKAHDHFHISKAHRQVYPKWTVPDLKEYGPQTRERFRRTLQVVDRSVVEERQKARNVRCFRPFPIQSSINLAKVVLPPPSISTVASSAQRTNRSVRRDSVVQVPPSPSSSTITVKPTDAAPSGPDETVVDHPHDFVPAPLPSPPSPEKVTIEQQPDARTSLAVDVAERSVESKTESSIVTSDSPVSISLAGLNLHFCLEAESAVETKNSQASGRATVGAEIAKPPEMEEGKCFDILEMAPGEERTIEREGGDSEKELVFMVRRGTQRGVRISCRWGI